MITDKTLTPDGDVDANELTSASKTEHTSSCSDSGYFATEKFYSAMEPLDSKDGVRLYRVRPETALDIEVLYDTSDHPLRHDLEVRDVNLHGVDEVFSGESDLYTLTQQGEDDREAVTVVLVADNENDLPDIHAVIDRIKNPTGIQKKYGLPCIYVEQDGILFVTLGNQSIKNITSPWRVGPSRGSHESLDAYRVIYDAIISQIISTDHEPSDPLAHTFTGDEYPAYTDIDYTASGNPYLGLGSWDLSPSVLTTLENIGVNTRDMIPESLGASSLADMLQTLYQLDITEGHIHRYFSLFDRFDRINQRTEMEMNHEQVSYGSLYTFITPDVFTFGATAATFKEVLLDDEAVKDVDVTMRMYDHKQGIPVAVVVSRDDPVTSNRMACVSKLHQIGWDQLEAHLNGRQIDKDIELIGSLRLRIPTEPTIYRKSPSFPNWVIEIEAINQLINEVNHVDRLLPVRIAQALKDITAETNSRLQLTLSDELTLAVNESIRNADAISRIAARRNKEG